MSVRDLNRRHVGLVAFYATRYAVRGGTGLVYLLVVLVAGLLVANAVLSPVEMSRREMERQSGREVDREVAAERLATTSVGYVSWVIGEREDVPAVEEILRNRNAGRPGWAGYLLFERPALLSAVLLVLLFLIPFMTILGAFNQYAGDIGSRGLRYQLLRTERANVYFGRYLGTVCFAALATGLLVAVVVAYMGIKLPFYGWGSLVAWGLRGWLALVVLTLPYAALCGWISGGFDSPFAALVICILVIVGVPCAAFLGAMQWEHATHVRWALPWAVQTRLLHHAGPQVALATLACLGYAALYLALGYRHFAKRDL